MRIKIVFLGTVMCVTAALMSGCNTTLGQLFGAPGGATYVASDSPDAQIPRVSAAFAGKTVAVVPYVNKTLAEYKYLGDASVGVIPEFLLEAGLQPVEASGSADLKKVLDEIEYGQSDRVDPATAVQVGAQLSAQYVFVGEVNSYHVTRPKGHRAVAIKGIRLNTGGASIKYDVQVSGRIIDVQTRAIIASKTIAHGQEFRLAGLGITTDWINLSQNQKIEVEQENSGKVLKTAMSRLVAAMVTQLNRRP